MRTVNTWRKVAVSVFLASAALPTLSMAMFCSPKAQFQRAKEKGARAKVCVRVTDDEGLPVSNATVKVFFEMVLNPGSKVISTMTDTNGVAIVKGNTNMAIHFRVTKDGYYMSEDCIQMFNMSHRYEVDGGKWQPWGIDKAIVLRPVRNPAATRIPVRGWKNAKETYIWLGFDLEKYDFVKPHGNGEHADFEMKFDWNGKRFKGYEGIELYIRFPRKYSGAYYVDRKMFSSFKDVYHAKSNATYQTEFHFYEHPVYNARGRMLRREELLFDPSKAWVVRSRCEIDEEGKLRQANYFLLSELIFSCSDEGPCISFQGVFNPTPNDTNLEPK